MDYEKVSKAITEDGSTVSYIILAIDGKGEHFITGGSKIAAIGLAEYAVEALKDYIRKMKPLVDMPSKTDIPTIVNTEGSA